MASPAQAFRLKLADDNPGVTSFRSDLAASHNALGNLLADTGRPVEAEAEYRKSLAIRQKLADDNPSNTALGNRLASRPLQPRPAPQRTKPARGG